MAKLKSPLSEALKDATATKSDEQTTAQEKEIRMPAVDAGVKGTDTSIKKNLAIREIEPSRCRPWAHHNRNKIWLTEEKIESLKASIEKEGQKQLGLVRKLKDDPDFDYEIIYGLRRWYACSLIPGRKFRAEITALDDKACARLMHIENEESENITEIEKAIAFREQITNNVFSGKSDLADSLNVSPSLVTRLTKAAELEDYPAIFKLFEPDLLNLSINGASKLVECLSDKATEKLMLNTAKILEEEGESRAASILKRLLMSAETEKPKSLKKVYLKHGKKPVFSLKKTANGKVTITIDAAVSKILSYKTQTELNKIFSEIIKEHY